VSVHRNHTASARRNQQRQHGREHGRTVRGVCFRGGTLACGIASATFAGRAGVARIVAGLRCTCILDLARRLTLLSELLYS